MKALSGALGKISKAATTVAKAPLFVVAMAALFVSARALKPAVQRRAWRSVRRALGASPERCRVLIIAGPTAVGKSAIAAEVIKRRGGGEIVSADSVQIYKGLNIGSNKPDDATMRRIRHHLVDVGVAAEPWNSGEWCRLAADSIADCASRGVAPIVVGGTMMYAQWLVRGLPDAPAASAGAAEASEAAFRGVLGKEWMDGVEVLTRDFGEEASKTAVEKISPNDWYRLSRTYEILWERKEAGGVVQKPQQQQRSPVLPESEYDVRCVFLAPKDRKALFRMIEVRCESMLEAGLVSEVGELVASGQLPRNSTAARAIGYRQTIDYLDNKAEQLDGDAYTLFCRDFATASRNYAKDQFKWYRRDKMFGVVHAHSPTTLEEVLSVMEMPRGDYEAWLVSAEQDVARGSLAADNKEMRLYVAGSPEAEKDPAVLKRHLARVAETLETLRASEFSRPTHGTRLEERRDFIQSREKKQEETAQENTTNNINAAE